MKEKVKLFAKAVRDFIKAHWVDILVAIVSAFLGAAFKSWMDKSKIKSYTYGESFESPETDGDIIIDSLAGWKIRLDTIGNNVVSAGLETSWFGKDEQDAKSIVHHSIRSNYTDDSSNDYFDFNYNKHNV